MARITCRGSPSHVVTYRSRRAMPKRALKCRPPMTLYTEAASGVSRLRQIICHGASACSKICVMNDLDMSTRAHNLHFVLSHLVRVEILEPLADSLRFPCVLRQVGVLRFFNHVALHEDRGPGAQRQRDRVARARVDRDDFAVVVEKDESIEGIVLQIRDD